MKGHVPIKKNTRRLGVDIGSYAVKLVEIADTNDGEQVTACNYRRLDGPSREDISGTLKGMFAESKVASKDLTISISGPHVITRFVTMPSMSDNDLKSALVFEVEKNIPFPAAEVVYDYQVLEREADKKMHILLVAVKREHVDKYLKIAGSCGLTLTAIDVDSFALTNAFLKRFGSTLDPAKTIALLNIGERYTNLDILRGRTLSFSRDIQVGGREVDEAIARVTNVDIAAAERLKLDPKDRAGEIGMPVRMILANLSDELRLSFGYFENKSGKSVDSICLSGGSSRLAGLKECLEEGLNMKVGDWDPFGVFLPDKGGIIPRDRRECYAVCVGLALR